MIEEISAYRLTCQGCGASKIREWESVRDVRVFVRSIGWWCSDEAQPIDGKHVWHIRCEACGAPTDDRGVGHGAET